MAIKIDQLTRQQKLDICTAYLAGGNSVHALCELIIECLGGTDIQSGAIEEFFDGIVGDMEESRKTADVGEFETTTEEEVNHLLEVAKGHEYEYLSVCWG